MICLYWSVIFMAKYILSYNLNSISKGYEELPAKLNNVGKSLNIYRGILLLKTDIDKDNIYESIKSTFNLNYDFLIFEIIQNNLRNLSEQIYDEILNLFND